MPNMWYGFKGKERRTGGTALIKLLVKNQIYMVAKGH